MEGLEFGTVWLQHGIPHISDKVKLCESEEYQLPTCHRKRNIGTHCVKEQLSVDGITFLSVTVPYSVLKREI
jgi:hypothetical protein